MNLERNLMVHTVVTKLTLWAQCCFSAFWSDIILKELMVVTVNRPRGEWKVMVPFIHSRKHCGRQKANVPMALWESNSPSVLSGSAIILIQKTEGGIIRPDTEWLGGQVGKIISMIQIWFLNHSWKASTDWSYIIAHIFPLCFNCKMNNVCQCCPFYCPSIYCTLKSVLCNFSCPPFFFCAVFLWWLLYLLMLVVLSG